MSAEEYNNLLLACQDTGAYRVFTFDIEDSKQYKPEDRYMAYRESCIVMERVYQDLKMLQEQTGRQILLDDKQFKPVTQMAILENAGQVPYDWFIIDGDAFGITIHNGSVAPEVVDQVFDHNREELGTTTGYHKYDIAYETNEYGQGNDQYFRGYAIMMSSNMHKKENKHLKRRIDAIKQPSSFTQEEIQSDLDIIQQNHEQALAKATENLRQFGITTTKKPYKLLSREGKIYLSEIPGKLGGNSRLKIYGRLDCPSANRWINKGHYVKNRVFFANEETAIAAGYRPCAVCMPEEYKKWKEKQKVKKSSHK